MKQDIKQKWIEALRSGHYEQGIGKLQQANMHGEYRYCCLGVLCDVISRNTAQEASNAGGQFLSKSTLDDLNLEEYDQEVLTRMNDDDGKDFDEIADYIEDYL